MSREELYKVAARQHGLLSSSQLERFGASSSVILDWVCTGRLERIAPAVYRVAGAPDTWLQRVMRATLDSGGWATHRTCGALRRLDGHDGRVIEVVVDRWKRSSKHDGYIVHESKDLRPFDFDVVQGISCTSLVRTLIDLPAVEHRFRAEQALDHACRLDADILPVVRARFMQVARRGRNGTRAMRSMLNERTGVYIPPGSSFEREALRWIERAGIDLPVKQFKVVDGDFTAHFDLAWPDLKLGVECESLAFHFGKAALERDRRRRRRLKALGWEVVEFSYDEVKSGAFIPELKRILASRTPDIRTG